MHNEPIPVAKLVFWGVFGIVALLAVSLGGCSGFKAYDRYQQRADRSQNRTQTRFDAQNQVRVNAIRIGYFAQQLKIAKQQAAIRRENAVGIREAQDEIAKTLTPLYVQFEMTQALERIASSGRNSSVVFIPSGASGIPLISNANGGQVGVPGGK